MTDIVLVRHGETEWSATGRYAGATDVALNDAGRDQARRLATWVGCAQLAEVWCSPLIRARETAEIAIGDAGLPLRIDPRLAELDFGEAEGLTSAQMRELFPDARTAFESDPARHPLPGGERAGAALARALSCLEEISAGNPTTRVMVVVHTTLIRLLVCHLLGIALGDYRRRLPFIDHGALTELRLDGGQSALLRLNAPPAQDGVR